MDEENKKKSNILINTVIIIVIFIVCVFMYAKYVGTSGVRIHEYKISSNKIPKNFDGAKIVYFSDYLYDGVNSSMMIEKSVQKINLLKPDIVLFGGGLISKGYKFSDEDKNLVIQEFSKIDAKLGKYAVLGFNDDKQVEDIINSSDFILLDNKEEDIYLDDNIPICLVGVGSYVKGAYDLNSSFQFKSVNPSCYTIMFTHEGDIINKLREISTKPDLVFAGNSLGGEIKIPFYGELFRNEGSMNYYQERYSIDNMDIYISSGFGTGESGMRLNNKPSFNFFRLKSLHEK